MGLSNVDITDVTVMRDDILLSCQTSQINNFHSPSHSQAAVRHVHDNCSLDDSLQM